MKFTDFLGRREEPLKNAIQAEFFADFTYTQLGNIDFVIAEKRPDNQRHLFGGGGGSIRSSGPRPKRAISAIFTRALCSSS